MRKVLLMLIMVVALSGCKSKDVTLEDCMLNYDSNNPYCTTEEHMDAFQDMLSEGNLIESDFNVTNFVMLSDNSIYVHINSNVLDKDEIVSWNTAIQYVSNQLGNNYEIEVIIS